MDDGTPVGIECTEEALAQIQEWMDAGIASFDKDKEMVMKCSCQNFVFTTEQAAVLIAKMTWNDDQAAAVEMFRDRLTNPSEGDAILALISEENQDAVNEILGSCTAAESREKAEYPIEDDGVRADEDVDRFVETLGKASFESDRMEAVEAEMKTMPSPPFSAAQLSQVLGNIKWSDEAVTLLEAMAAVGAIYPLSCTEIGEFLGKYMMSADKLKMLAAVKPLIKDAQNKAMLVSVFEFPDDKASAEEILRDVIVNFKPDEVPEEKIQEAIRAIGSCAAGYAWRQVQGGWRCAAGGHYVSDEMIQNKLDSM